MDSHYTAISSKYNDLFEPFHQANTPIIIKRLQLTPDDHLLDIGAATGQQAHLIWKQVGLKNPVTCVEPCQAFFEHASKLDGIVPVIQTAEQFCDRLLHGHVPKDKPRFNKVLVFGVAHHFDNIPKVLAQIIDYLPKNGVCGIFNHPSVGISLPFTDLQIRHFSEIPDIKDDMVSYLKSHDDIATELTNEEFTYKIPKSRWYYMIRNRFWSTIRRYTDEEIKESIKELNDGRFKGVKEDELITVTHKLFFIKVTKI